MTSSARWTERTAPDSWSVRVSSVGRSRTRATGGLRRRRATSAIRVARTATSAVAGAATAPGAYPALPPPPRASVPSDTNDRAGDQGGGRPHGSGPWDHQDVGAALRVPGPAAHRIRIPPLPRGGRRRPAPGGRIARAGHVGADGAGPGPSHGAQPHRPPVDLRGHPGLGHRAGPPAAAAQALALGHLAGDGGRGAGPRRRAGVLRRLPARALLSAGRAPLPPARRA